MHYAENECAMPIRLHCNELRALCLTTSALCHTAEIGALLHIFSFAFGQCSISIWRQIRQFVNERNTSINSTTDCPISKTDWTLVIVNWTLCQLSASPNRLVNERLVSSHWFECGRYLVKPFGMNAELFWRYAILYAQCWSYAEWRTETKFRRTVTHIGQSLCTNCWVRCRVLLLCWISFGDWPPPIAKRCTKMRADCLYLAGKRCSYGTLAKRKREKVYTFLRSI